jgi:uncharacterized membrane protein YhhN
MKKIFLYLFVTVAVVHLVACFLGLGQLHDYTKPLLIPLLAAYYFSVSREYRSPMVLGALLFSFAGDVLLMNPSNFISGLVCFLIAHILYVVAYRQHRMDMDQQPVHGIQRVRIAFPVVLAGTGLVVVLFPRLGEMKVPVIIYAMVITVMVLSALFRIGRTNAHSFWMVLGGAVTFMASDSILAINKFLIPITNANFLIMLTYIAAQWLIVEGLLRHHTATPTKDF